MASASSIQLETLPNEIVANICEHLDKSDLISLRFTNKHISNLATTVLAKNYICHISVLMTHRSLELLGDICTSPRFGPYIRLIHLNSGRISPSNIQTLTENLTSLYDNQIGNENREEIRRARREVQCCMDRSTREYRLEESPEAAVELFSRALESLKTYGTGVDLIVHDEACPDWVEDWLPLEKTELDVDGHYYLGSESRFRSTMEPFLKAIAHTQCQFKSINLQIGKPSPDPTEEHLDIADTAREALSAFSRLRSFIVHANNEIHREGALALEQILSHVNNLTDLNFMSYDQFGEVSTPKSCFDTRDRMFDSVISGNLEYLNLDFLPLSYNNFISLLDRNRHTLRHLEIDSCALRGGTWCQVFSWARDNLDRIDILRIDALYEAEGPLFPDDSFRTTLRVAKVSSSKGSEVRGEFVRLAALASR